MNAIHVFFSDPAMRPLLVRMNESKDNLRKDDVRALVVFFGNEAMRYRREKRTARWPRWLSALWKRL